VLCLLVLCLFCLLVLCLRRHAGAARPGAAAHEPV